MQNVSMFNMSQKAAYDVIMQVRLADIVDDLCAAEGKYNLDCWVRFQQAMEKLQVILNPLATFTWMSCVLSYFKDCHEDTCMICPSRGTSIKICAIHVDKLFVQSICPGDRASSMM